MKIAVHKKRRELIEKLQKGGIDAPAFEAGLFMCHFFSVDQKTLMSNVGMEIEEEDLEELEKAVGKRLSGEPLQYILGQWEFMGLPFFVEPGVLIPRSDTEILVERALEQMNEEDRGLSVLDMCSGSGCIGIAIAAFCEQARVMQWDYSQKAVALAQKNIQLNELTGRVSCREVDIFQAQGGAATFDYVLCNPPYLTKEDMENLQKEVSYEPEDALYGGEDGLDYYRFICENFWENIRRGGWLFFEGGASQEKDIRDIMEKAGFAQIRTFKDYGGNFRVICGKRA